METLIIQPKTKEQLTALKAFIKAMKIDFRSEKSPYDPEFVEKILQRTYGSNLYSKGCRRIKVLEEIWK